MPIIDIKNLSIHYKKIKALQKISFTIEKNEFIGIIGPNGGGKTTLIKAILGIINPTYGSIKISKNEIFGYVPQAATFDETFPISVKEVVLLGHIPQKISLFQRFTKSEKKHVTQIMKELNIKNLCNRQISELSGGQKQKVLIARALMNHPTILVLDEPTSGIDESSKSEIYKMLKKLNEDMTILIVTHQPNELIDLFDKMIFINQKAHVHYKQYCYDYTDKKTKKPCPIDWYVEGEKIQSEFINKKGSKNQ